MATYKEVQGNDVLLLFDLGDGFKPFVCAREFSLEITSALVNKTTKGDGQDDKFAYQSRGYTITCTGVVVFDDTAITSFDLQLLQYNFLEVQWKALFVTRDQSSLKSYKGTCLIERSLFSGNAGQLSLSDFSLRGSGAYTIIDCDITITDVGISNPAGERFATVIGTTGEPPAYFIWQLDTGFEQTSLSTFFSIGTMDNGDHKLIVTPVCTGDKRGNPFTKEFFVFNENPAVTCPAVATLSASSVSSTSFDLNFTTVAEGTSYTARIKNTATGTVIFRYSTTSPFHITGLLPNTEYLVNIITVCNVDSSTYSAGIIVHTNP